MKELQEAIDRLYKWIRILEEEMINGDKKDSMFFIKEFSELAGELRSWADINPKEKIIIKRVPDHSYYRKEGLLPERIMGRKSNEGGRRISTRSGHND